MYMYYTCKSTLVNAHLYIAVQEVRTSDKNSQNEYGNYIK